MDRGPLLELDVRSASYPVPPGTPPRGGVDCPVRLSLGPGERATLCGPSGCGKSTLLKIAAGIHPHFEGRRTAARGLRVGYMPQDPCLLPFRTVEENLLGFARAAGRGTGRREAQRLCDALGIGALARRYPTALSGGQYRRAMLGRVLLAGPRLLILDEPFTGLDAAAREAVWEVLTAYLGKTSSALLLATHQREADPERLGRVFIWTEVGAYA